MRFIDKINAVHDTRPRRLHDLLKREGIVPDEPFMSLAPGIEHALERVVDALTRGQFDDCITCYEWLPLDEQLDHANEAAWRIQGKIEKQEREEAARAEQRTAIQQADQAFAGT